MIPDDLTPTPCSIPCLVCKGEHETYNCCDKCNYDTHYCPGCGEPLYHGRICCSECAKL